MKRVLVVLLLVLCPFLVASGSAPAASADPATPAVGASQTTYTVMAAGDIACAPTFSHFNGGQGDSQYCHELATANLLLINHPDAVLALGDNQYENASLSEFQGSYEQTWGRLRSITYPTTGNHEYVTPDAAGYFAYFGSQSAPQHGGYYSFEL